MGEVFQVQPEKLEAYGGNLEKIRAKLCRIEGEVRTLSSNLSMEGMTGRCFRAGLRASCRKLESRSLEMKALQETLETCMHLYLACENRLLELSVAPVMTTRREKTDQKILKKQVAKVLAKGAYTEEAWKKASLEEREQLLQQYMQELSSVMGVAVEETILFVDEPPNANGIITFGTYNYRTNQIKINRYVLEREGIYHSYRLMATIAHELRHAYQHTAIDHPERYSVTSETIVAWKESFASYGQEKTKGYQSYREILVEQDARAFAGQE